MAKIFSTEQLSLDGDKIRIKAGDNANTIRITSSDGNSVFFRETDVSSLHDQDSVNVSTLNSSIDAAELSLHEQDSVNVSTLNASISTLSATVESGDVQAITKTVPSGDASVTVNFDAGFTQAPSVVGTLISSDANDPIIGVQLQGTITTGAATFVFSDDMPNSNYSLEVLASQ